MILKIIRSLRQKKFILEFRNSYVSLSKDGKTRVVNTTEGGADVRLLLVNNTRESATYTLPFLRNEPVFDYVRRAGKIILSDRHLTHVLLLGGAGFSIPKYILSQAPEKTVTVVEIDEEMVNIARKYFYLDDLIRDFAPDGSGRLSIRIGDAANVLRESTKTFDVIINDAFIGNIADAAMNSDEGMRLIAKHLRPGGLYIVNLISALKGADAMPGEMALARARRYFLNASLTPARTDDVPVRRQNCLLLASEDSISRYEKIY